MADKKSKPQPKIRITLLRGILIGALFVLLAAGVYAYFSRTRFGTALSIGAVLALVGAAVCVAVGVPMLNRRGILPRVLKPVLIVLVVAVVLINGKLLDSADFVPHRTTTVMNRFFPISLEGSMKMQKYLKGKTLYIDESNAFFDLDRPLSAIDHSHIASILSSVESVKVLDEPFGMFSDAQVAYLQSLTDEYEMVDWYYYRAINSFFFYDILESDEVVFIWGLPMGVYFITPERFEAVKEIQ